MSATPLQATGQVPHGTAHEGPHHRLPARDLDLRSLRAALWPLTLSFRDRGMERRFQLKMGREGLIGYQLSCAVGVILWLLASQVVPVRHPGDSLAAPIVAAIGITMNLGGLIASRWANTLDRQNAIATPIAIGNGVGALVLASVVGVTEAYAASALVLTAVFFFVARVRFVFAATRIAALLAGFSVVAALEPAPHELVLDAFILLAAMTGVLLGLYRMELTTRRLFRSELEVAAQSDALARENHQAQALLLNILPVPVADRLRAGEDTIADDVPDATVLFADLVGFTPLAHGMAPAELVRHLDELFSRFDAAAEDAGIEKIKTIGDAYMAVGGIPRALRGHPDRVVALGLRMIAIVARYAHESGLPLQLRVGVHSGPLVAGVIGTHKFQYDLWGDTVNVASRLEASSVPGAVQVSGPTHDRLTSGLTAERRGAVPLKGVGPMETWLIRPAPAAGAGPETVTVPS